MIGIDVAEIARYEKHVDRPRFLDRILTENERQSYLKKPTAEHLATFFAVKEAVAKALGTGIGAYGWTDIELQHDALGKPSAQITDRNRKKTIRAAVTVSHDAGIVIAAAVLVGEEPLLEDAATRELRALLRPRDISMHKGQAGRACVLGGQAGMTGSVCLASRAVLRSGAGYAFAIVRPEVYAIVQQKLLEPMVLPLLTEAPDPLLERLQMMDAVAVGPGLGTDALAEQILQTVLASATCPVVIDADALTILSKYPGWFEQKNSPWILTPHAGELKRLFAGTGIQNSAALAKKYDMILIEKGPSTKIHARRTVTNPTGNPGLATAGTGDVLTGIVTGLLARGYAPETAARLGVWLHGAAGDLARADFGEEGMIASDVLERIPAAHQYLKGDTHAYRQHMGRD